jgi:hypothetical protein
MVNLRAVPAAGADQLAGVVAVGAADDDDDIAAAGEIGRSGLALLGRLADGVDVADLGTRKPPPD